MHNISEKIVYAIFSIAYVATCMDANKVVIALIFAAGYAILATKKK